MKAPLAQLTAWTPSALPGDIVLGFVLFDVLVILVAARLLGALARKLGQPTVVGEIVAGVLLGPTLLGATVFNWGHPWRCCTATRLALSPRRPPARPSHPASRRACSPTRPAST
ncbi:MAG: cation:proton antiporter [Geodermatophilaceae bacterium]|nr:cation:proton antiporter [Geodermatophilaceae bacterium]